MWRSQYRLQSKRFDSLSLIIWVCEAVMCLWLVRDPSVSLSLSVWLMRSCALIGGGGVRGRRHTSEVWHRTALLLCLRWQRLRESMNQRSGSHSSITESSYSFYWIICFWNTQHWCDKSIRADDKQIHKYNQINKSDICIYFLKYIYLFLYNYIYNRIN